MPSAFERALQAQKRSDFTSRFSNLPSSLGGRTTTPPRTSVGPKPENLRRLLGDPDPGTGGGTGGGSGGVGGTPPPPPPRPDLDPPTTNGVTQPFRYSNELPPLTPQQQRALMERRRAATRSFEETQAVVGRERARAEGDVLRQQGEVDRNRRLQSRAGMQTLAGRGVGRSPMFVNPFERQLTEQSQRQTAELQSGLAGTLSQLRSALQQAEIGRDREFAQIDFDAVDERADVGRLLGA